MIDLLGFTPNLQKYDFLTEPLKSTERKLFIQGFSERMREFINVLGGTRCLESLITMAVLVKIED